MDHVKLAGAVLAVITASAAAHAETGVTVVRGTPKAAAPSTTAAQGFPAIATVDVYMRAQPHMSAPTVTIVPAYGAVTVYGCHQDRSWCDVAWEQHRGWVAGAYFSTPYQNPWDPGARAFPHRGVPVATYYGAPPWYPYWHYPWAYGGYWGPYRGWWGPHIGIGIGWHGYWGSRRWGHRGRWR